MSSNPLGRLALLALSPLTGGLLLLRLARR
jgi:hypothetical protein